MAGIRSERHCVTIPNQFPQLPLLCDNLDRLFGFLADQYSPLPISPTNADILPMLVTAYCGWLMATDFYCHTTKRSHCNMVNVLHNIHDRCPIASQWEPSIGCLLWVQSFIYCILLFVMKWCVTSKIHSSILIQHMFSRIFTQTTQSSPISVKYGVFSWAMF